MEGVSNLNSVREGDVGNKKRNKINWKKLSVNNGLPPPAESGKNSHRSLVH